MDVQSLRPLISEQEIGRRVRELALELSRDYKGRSPLFLGVLKGAYVFLADLTRLMDEPPEIDFIQLSSYGLKGTAGSDRISVRLRPGSDLQGRDVVVVEDIVDTGRTLRFLRRYLARRGPASLRVCALLVRTHARDEEERLVDYRGFTVGEGWLVGYGLDCSERYRALPDIYVVEGEQ
jgi:hypoxanthine phosphoribosyltransferase